MKKVFLISLALITSFGLGFAFNNLMAGKSASNERKVTGIGGIFFKCKDPGKVKEWYQTNLGLKTNPYGAVFEWKQALDSTKKGFTQWSPFSEKTKYFDKDYMINYRVENLTTLIKELRKNGVTIADSVQTDELGKFVHIIDIEGNKVELWEPNDIACEKYGKENGMPTTK
jgi:predicted enzyme related to lactoylglutathione lyase